MGDDMNDLCVRRLHVPVYILFSCDEKNECHVMGRVNYVRREGFMNNAEFWSQKYFNR